MEQGSLQHPNWRAAKRELERTFEREMLAERESGKLPASLSAWDIREMARKKAVDVVSGAVNVREQSEAARKRKTGEAA